MNITNTMCRLSELTQEQIDSLVDAMPEFCFIKSRGGMPDISKIGFSRNNAGFWYGTDSTKIISYKEMMQLLGKTMEFTKSDLKTGMFVKYRNGGIRLVLADFVTGTYWRSLNNVAENLKSVDCQRDLDIMSVYEALRPTNIESYLNGEDLKLIWERTEQTPAQKEMQELLSNIEKAEKDMADMKEQAKVLQAKL
jgi:hypothetical protein